jgi:hypothetical protein
MNSFNTSYPRRKQPVWRWMILFGCMTFMMSLVLIKAVSPVGDAIIARQSKGAQTQQALPAVNTSAHHAAAPAQPSRL